MHLCINSRIYSVIYFRAISKFQEIGRNFRLYFSALILETNISLFFPKIRQIHRSRDLWIWRDFGNLFEIFGVFAFFAEIINSRNSAEFFCCFLRPISAIFIWGRKLYRENIPENWGKFRSNKGKLLACYICIWK